MKSVAVFEEDGKFMVPVKARGVSRIPLEVYVEGALAASIPAGCEEETLKAQAVILRTMCMKAYEDRASVEETTISAREIGQDYLDLREREALWGSSAVDNQAKISRAVSETKGMYLTWEGKLIEPAYFWLSAGKTRNAGRCWAKAMIIW